MRQDLLIAFATFALFISQCHADDFVISNADEFAKIVGKEAKLEKLAGGMKFLEGPCWFDDAGGYLLFSDIPSNQIKKWSDKEKLTTFREPSQNTNGNTRDAEGRLIACEHSARRVTRTEKDGKITVLADSHDGKKLNSPNDVVVKPDGAMYFTDPTYGIPKGERKEQAKNHVFHLDPKTGKVTAIITDSDQPNGVALSPDGKQLYVADSGKPRNIRVFEIRTDGTVGEGKVFCTIDKGSPDGIRVDSAGRVFSSAGDGVQIFAPDGKLIGKILVPESPANLAFGGKDGSELYITARTSLYRIKLLAK